MPPRQLSHAHQLPALDPRYGIEPPALSLEADAAGLSITGLH